MPGDLTYFKKNAVNYYGVFCSEFDKGSPYDDKLTEVRKQYYESGLRTQKNKITSRKDDGIYRYNYTLNEDTILKWKVFNEAHIVEKVIVSKDDNYRVEIRDRFGKQLKKCIYFGTYHNWIKTKYFVEGKVRPEAELVYWDEKGVAVILKYTSDGDDRYPDVLYPCTAVEDKALFQRITEKLGVPDVYTLCSGGLVYFAEKTISRQWNRYCANPKLLDEADDIKPKQTNLSDKTTVFDPVGDMPKKNFEPKKRIDLTQTYDVIVPNAVQADNVIIHKNQDEKSSGIPSRSIGDNNNKKDESIKTADDSPKSENQTNTLKQKLHSDSLLEYSENSDPDEKSSLFSQQGIDFNKKFDTMEFLGGSNAKDVLEKDDMNLTLNIDLDEEDDDNRVLDSSDAVTNDPPQIFNSDTRAYSYKKVRASHNNENQSDNPFAEFENEGVIQNKTAEKKSEESSSQKSPDQPGSKKSIDLSKQDHSQKRSESSRPSFEFASEKQRSPGEYKGLRPDKIIKVSGRDSYSYYGGLDENGKRDGRGRTAMQNGLTAYDGGYSNDMRNGFGVYYYRNGSICYVGDWKDNLRNGVGISFEHSNRSMYVGGWENNCPIGMGAQFDKNGNLAFAGRYENGTREGIGMVYNPEDGGVFVSRWENDKLSKKGTVFDSMGNLIYNGSWKKGTKNGMGTQYDKNGLVVYSGMWKDGKYNGEGTLNLSNGYKIAGEFVMGRVEGNAVVTTQKGKKLYEGEWKNNRYNGEGKLYNLKNGSWCQGSFSNGNPVGVLFGYSRDGELLYEGEWKNGKYHGQGICYDNGEKIYEGEWKNGIRSGSGCEYKDGGCVYDGNYEDNMRNGFGTSYSDDGEIEYSGLWKNDCYDGIGVLYISGQPCYAGNFSNGKPEGRVNEILNGIVVKECIFKDGECVYMREFTDDGLTLKYEGHVKDGHYEGMGCGFSAYGEKYFEGIFKKNEPFKNMKVRLKQLEKLVYSDAVSESEYGKFIKGPNYVVEWDYKGGSYSGLLVKGKPSGKGTVIYSDHGYTGSFEDGTACGIGVIYEWDGSEIKGTFEKTESEDTQKITFSGGVTYYLRNT